MTAADAANKMVPLPLSIETGGSRSGISACCTSIFHLRRIINYKVTDLVGLQNHQSLANDSKKKAGIYN